MYRACIIHRQVQRSPALLFSDSGDDGLGGLYLQIVAADQPVISTPIFSPIPSRPKETLEELNPVIPSNTITNIIDALIPASSALKVLDLGGQGLTRDNRDIPGYPSNKKTKPTKFPKLEFLSIDCPDLSLESNPNALGDLARYCPNLKHLVLVDMAMMMIEVDYITPAVFALAMMLAGRRDGSVQLRKVTIYCNWPNPPFIALALGPYTSWFAAVNVEVVLMEGDWAV